MAEHGIPCTACGEPTGVIEGRPGVHNTYRRRRKCLSCDWRFTTYERVGKNDVTHITAAMAKARRHLRLALKAFKELDGEKGRSRYSCAAKEKL